MSSLITLMLATAFANADARSLQSALPATFLLEDGDSPASQGKERIVIRKDGGPGHGADQPYDIREQGAGDLERFVGGKYIFFVGPWDVIVLLLIVVLVVILVILL